MYCNNRLSPFQKYILSLIERHYAAVDEGWGSTVGEPEVFARWGTRLADRRHGSGYKDPEPGTWRFLLPPEKGNSGRMTLSAELWEERAGKKRESDCSLTLPPPARVGIQWSPFVLH